MAQAQKEKFAAEAFRKKFSDLHDAIGQPHVVSKLASKLYSEEMITPETRDAVQTTGTAPTKQAYWLLRAVESSIKMNHTVLRKFTCVLKKQPALSPIAKRLHQHYSDLVSKARLTESSSSGSDTDSTEQPQGQGIPKNIGTQNYQLESSPATAGILERSMLGQSEQRAGYNREECTRTNRKRKRRIEEDTQKGVKRPCTKITRFSTSGSDTDSTEQHQSQGQRIPKHIGAGNEQLETSSATAGILERSMLGQCEQKAGEACTITKRRIKDLEMKYANLVVKAQKEVKKEKPDLEIFCTEITLLPSHMKEEYQQDLKDFMPQLYNAKSIPEIFGVLNLIWNYLHYGLLQHIIELYGSDDTKKLMKSYIEDVKSFQQETTLAMFWEADPNRRRPKSLGGDIIEALTSHAKLTSSSFLKSVEEFRQESACEISLLVFVNSLKKYCQGVS